MRLLASSLASLALAACESTERRDATENIASSRRALEAPRVWIERGNFSVDAHDEPLGRSLAATEDVAVVVGSAAFLFERVDSSWNLTQPLETPTTQDVIKHVALASNGAALSIESDGRDEIILYEPQKEGWLPVQTLTEAELGVVQLDSLALTESLLAVAARPAVDLTAIIAMARTEQGIGAPSQVYAGEEVQELSLAVSADQVLIGAPYADAPNGGEGVVHVYGLDNGAWLETTTLFAPEPETVQFGLALSATRRRVVVGTRTGQVYVFDREAAGFAPPVRIDPPQEVTQATHSVAVSASAVLVGLPELSLPSIDLTGAAYMAFDTKTGWSESVWLPHGYSLAQELYGYTVALTADAALVAAPYANRPLSLGVVYGYGPCASDSDCRSGSYCDAQGACAVQKSQGEPCAPEQDCASADCQVCASSFCTDGYCCEAACDAQCQACDEAGHAGECRAIAGAPRGQRQACAGDDATCGGVCDGRSSACVYAAALTPCASQCADGIVTQYGCDGAGSCTKSGARACAGYACVADACATQCLSEADCVTGFACLEGACVPAPVVACSEDGSASVGRDGTSRCAPYKCDTTGRCASDCSATADCAEGYVCEVTRRACVFETRRRAPQDGCGCRLVRPASTTSSACLASMALALWRRRRATSRRAA